MESYPKSFFITFCVIQILCGHVHADSECRTPDNVNGICIPLQKCQSLYSILEAGTLSGISTSQRQFLRYSQCGQIGSKPLVCCPMDSQFTTTDSAKCGQFSEERILINYVLTTDYPWLALIHHTKPKNQSESGFNCGGVLITQNHVLTAAHCVQNENLTKDSIDFVRLSEYNLKDELDCDSELCSMAEDIRVAEIIVHENDNIALIRLAQPAIYSDFIAPICLPVASHLQNKSFDDQHLTITGFGGIGSAMRSDMKLMAAVDYVNFDSCSKIYSSQNLSLNSNQLCAKGRHNKKSCVVDSGGPLMAFDRTDMNKPYIYVVGIESFGARNCESPSYPLVYTSYPLVYTKIGRYIDWISDHIGH